VGGGAEGFGGVSLEWVVIEVHHFVAYLPDFIELIDDQGSFEVQTEAIPVLGFLHQAEVFAEGEVAGRFDGSGGLAWVEGLLEFRRRESLVDQSSQRILNVSEQKKGFGESPEFPTDIRICNDPGNLIAPGLDYDGVMPGHPLNHFEK